MSVSQRVRSCWVGVAALAGLATVVLVSPPALAQQGAADVAADRELTTAGFPLARAFLVDGAPEIDGDVLGEAIWDDIVPATGFLQNTPDEGQPASERTEVRIIYTEDTVYFGIVCYVSDPSTIIVSDSRRDSSLDDTDSFQIIIDTYLDKQNGFLFGTNPAGLEYDGQVTNEGQGGGRFGGGVVRRSGSQQQRGSGGGFNVNWDGVWQVSAEISELGWTAEIAIPFRTLRYPSGGVQTWGLNFQRNIRSRNEQSYWAPLPRQFRLHRLSLAGELQGIEVPPQRNLKLTPYVLGEALRRTDDTKTTALGDFGADLKYSVTPSMTLDLTYSTDFAQVEVDDQQVNLDRFNLFFPEKRPFFLENAGLFSVGQPGQLEVFFSRRVGIGEGGGQIPIFGGGRLSGKVGSNTNVGFLNIQTQSVNATGTPSNNFTVARVRQDFQNRSNIGAMFVNRGATGNLAGERDYNRSYAVDGRWGIGQTGTVSGFAAQTDTPGLKGDTHAFNMAANYDSERYQLRGGFTEVGPNFNPEVGFYARRGYRRSDASVRTTFRPQNPLGILEWYPHASHYTIWNFVTGQQETQYTHLDNGIEWRNGYQVSTGVNLTKEGVLKPFEIFPGVTVPVDTYDHAEAIMRFNTNQGAPISFTFRATVGGFFGGERVQMGPEVSMRTGQTFNAQLSWSRNDIDLPGGAFVANLGTVRLNYSFTTRMFLQALVQYNDRADLWSSNIRFAILSDANTGLFIVYNDTQGLGDVRPTGAGRTLTIKYSQLFDVLN
ncbi:MAG TPA: hydrolase [Acidobacteria bacterium]|nr:hydrolase [Acidobacteriota bacterium]